MSIDGITLAAIKNDLSSKIPGARIDKIYQPENNTITLTLRNSGENHQLLISAHPQEARIHLTKLGLVNPVKAPDFCMLLRKYLLRGIITGIEQPDFERILVFQIKLRNNHYSLIVEIMGKYSNIILVDNSGTVLDAIKRVTFGISRVRQIYPGIEYQYPPKQDKLNPLNITCEEFRDKISTDYQSIISNIRGIGPEMAKEVIWRAENIKEIWNSFNYFFNRIKKGEFAPTAGIDKKGLIVYISPFPLKHKTETAREISFNNTGELFDYYYENLLIKSRLEGFKNSLLNVINTFLKKNKKKQKKTTTKLKEGEDADIYQQLGQLITANIFKIEKGVGEIEVINYYDNEQKIINIPLDPGLTPAKNAQVYFKKYSKAKRSIRHLKKQLGILRHEEKYLNEVSFNIEQAGERAGLIEIQNELKEEGYIKKKRNRSKEKTPALPPHHFKSSQDYDILVGRNNKQNDYLTKKIASNRDLWLHIKDEAGSHVIIRNHTGKEVPFKTIREAAALAAYYSKGRDSENVPVDYTGVKNVNKPKGARPGLVYYENYQTIYINPEKGHVKEIR